MKFNMLLLVCFTLLLSSSKCENSECENGAVYTAKDYTGMDGCRLLFEDKDGKLFEPSNLDEFDMQLVDGDKYVIASETISMPSICMMGEGMKISCIETVN